MSEEGGAKKPGTIGWIDLTVENADAVREFYEAVAGWKASGIDMGGYSDYAMVPPGADDAVAGVCHARGPNTGLPPQWLIYITVADVDESIRECEQRGGKVIAGPKKMGDGKYCVIQDPAGAMAGLIDTGEKQG